MDGLLNTNQIKHKILPMQNTIIHFNTEKEVSDAFYILLANVIPCCENELNLVKNERSDASYQYQLHCPKHRKFICKINWNNEIVTSCNIE